jgi:uncharacterized protein (TIGR03435 family)
MVACALAVAAVAQTAPAYDAVSIKPNKAGNDNQSTDSSPGRYSASNTSLKSLIRYAWDLQSEDAVVGLPGWAESARFDIEAKADADSVAAMKKMKPDDASAMRRAMMQAMLIERFKLKLHGETRDLPVYLLQVAKGGSKLTAFDDSVLTEDGKSRGGSMGIDNGHMVAVGVPMDNLTRTLSRRLHRIVVDRTGLKGKYDFTMDFPRDDGAGDADGPSVFTVIQETLGLKLEGSKAPVPVVVVDGVEQPSEN